MSEIADLSYLIRPDFLQPLLDLHLQLMRHGGDGEVVLSFKQRDWDAIVAPLGLAEVKMLGGEMVLRLVP